MSEFSDAQKAAIAKGDVPNLWVKDPPKPPSLQSQLEAAHAEIIRLRALVKWTAESAYKEGWTTGQSRCAMSSRDEADWNASDAKRRLEQ